MILPRGLPAAAALGLRKRAGKTSLLPLVGGSVGRALGSMPLEVK